MLLARPADQQDMTKPMRRISTLFLAGALALPACATEQVGPEDLHAQTTQTRPDQGALLIATSPTPDSLTARLMQPSTYRFVDYEVFIDGRRLVRDPLYDPSASRVNDGGATECGFIAAGPHHFAIADEGGGPLRFTGDFVMPAGALTRLYTYGPRDALRGVFVAYPLLPASGNKHVNVANLLLDDTRLEVMSCDDQTHCTPISPPLAAGEVFDTDLPLTGAEDYDWSLNASGAGIGVRQVATTALPAPPVFAIYRDVGTTDVGPAVDWASAIMYMRKDGLPDMGTN